MSASRKLSNSPRPANPAMAVTCDTPMRMLSAAATQPGSSLGAGVAAATRAAFAQKPPPPPAPPPTKKNPHLSAIALAHRLQQAAGEPAATAGR